MKGIDLSNIRQFWSTRISRPRKILLLAVLGLAAGALATPPSGFVTNTLLATGVSLDNEGQNVQLARDPVTGNVDPWGAEFHTHGATDFYMQHLVLGAGGYSGWHTHPGTLIGIVTSGSVDFYDANCQKRTVGPGGVYFENDAVHGIINTGTVNADLKIAYLIKHGAPRRLDASAPACAPATGIP